MRHNKKSDPCLKGKVVDVHTDIMHTGKCLFLITKAGNGQHHQSKYIKARKIELVAMRLKERKDYYRS
eukprot:6114618-Ditylum_brightwellii.AAC.1